MTPGNEVATEYVPSDSGGNASSDAIKELATASGESTYRSRLAPPSSDVGESKLSIPRDVPKPQRIARRDVSAQIVADRLIDMCRDYGDLLTNLKLQKLLYYAQAWHLALYGTPLFHDRFEAWAHGPVQPEVYAHFARFKDGPIDRPRRPVRFAPKIESHLRDVLEAYGSLSAFDLERLSQDELPWKEARKGLSPDEPATTTVSSETMKRYYKARYDEQESEQKED